MGRDGDCASTSEVQDDNHDPGSAATNTTQAKQGMRVSRTLGTRHQPESPRRSSPPTTPDPRPLQHAVDVASYVEDAQSAFPGQQVTRSNSITHTPGREHHPTQAPTRVCVPPPASRRQQAQAHWSHLATCHAECHSTHRQLCSGWCGTFLAIHKGNTVSTSSTRAGRVFALPMMNTGEHHIPSMITRAHWGLAKRCHLTTCMAKARACTRTAKPLAHKTNTHMHTCACIHEHAHGTRRDQQNPLDTHTPQNAHP